MTQQTGLTRGSIVAAVFILLAALLALDLTTSPPNPYDAPDLFAFGSGAAPTGGFCGAPAMAPGQ